MWAVERACWGHGPETPEADVTPFLARVTLELGSRDPLGWLVHQV